MKKTFKSLCEDKGYIVYCDESVISKVPSKIKGNVEIFKLDKYISDDDLEKEYESRGLIPADPYSMLDFWDGEKYLGTHWKDTKGNWCYATFYRWNDKRKVFVDRDGVGWDGYWWFAGVRRYEIKTSDTKNYLETLTLEKAIDICKENGLVVYEIK